MRAYWLGFCAASAAKQPCGKHLCIIEDNQIIRFQQVREIPELIVLEQTRGHMQQTGSRSVYEGFLGNQFFRQIVIEVLN
jgi:hypothetical protein